MYRTRRLATCTMYRRLTESTMGPYLLRKWFKIEIEDKNSRRITQCSGTFVVLGEECLCGEAGAPAMVSLGIGHVISLGQNSQILWNKDGWQVSFCWSPVVLIYSRCSSTLLTSPLQRYSLVQWSQNANDESSSYP